MTKAEALANFGQILDRVEAEHQAFIVENGGHPVCRIAPIQPTGFKGRDFLELLKSLPRPDESFAQDLKQILNEKPVEIPRQTWD